MTALYATDQPVLVLYPLPDDDVNDRSSWHWLEGQVVEVTESPTVEYAVVVQDERVMEPDPIEDNLVYPIAFRDPTEVQARPASSDVKADISRRDVDELPEYVPPLIDRWRQLGRTCGCAAELEAVLAKEPERAGYDEQKHRDDMARAREAVRAEIATRPWAANPPEGLEDAAASFLDLLRIFFEVEDVDEAALAKIHSAAGFCVDAALFARRHYSERMRP